MGKDNDGIDIDFGEEKSGRAVAARLTSVALLTLLCVVCLTIGFFAGRESIRLQVGGFFSGTGSPDSGDRARAMEQLDAEIKANDDKLFDAWLLHNAGLVPDE